jgi:hypothetical protein
MNLDEKQKKTVASWIQDGLKLSEIQKRLATEFGLNLTYMDVRLVVDDLKLVPKDVPRVEKTLSSAVAPAGAAPLDQKLPEPEEESTPALPGSGKVSITVDSIARPGSLVSGSVTFSDGQSGIWYLDQYGRMGIGPKQAGYKPSAADMQAFQQTLERELAKMGL